MMEGGYVMDNPQQKGPELRKDLGLVAALSLVVGMVLGAGKEFMLRRFRPMLVAVVLGAIAGRIAVMLALHFLQEDDIGMEESDRLLQGVHSGQAPHGGDTLVDIISCYADFHALILLPDGPRAAPA